MLTVETVTSVFDAQMFDILRLPLLEVVLIGALAGLVGVLAVLNERIFFLESVTHGTFPGAVLGVVIGSFLTLYFFTGAEKSGGKQAFLSLCLFVGAFILCLPLAALMHYLGSIRGISSQAAAGMVLTLGFALGYFLDKWFSPLPLKIENFLTGSILTVNHADITAAALVLALSLLVIIGGGKKLFFYAFDKLGYRASGHRPWVAEGVILALICLTVVVAIPAVGTILSVALVAAPAAGLRSLVSSPVKLCIWAPVAGILIGISGLFIALVMHLSTGGVITLVAGIFYVVCRLGGKAFTGIGRSR